MASSYDRDADGGCHGCAGWKATVAEARAEAAQHAQRVKVRVVLYGFGIIWYGMVFCIRVLQYDSRVLLW